MTDAVPIRTARPDDFPAVADLLGFAFHHTPTAAERDLEQALYEPARSLVAEDDGTLVGHATAFTREMTVPGAVLPVAHVSMVGVAPTHRRLGLLTRMMRRQLTDVAEAGRQPLAALWASEGKIYPRYGYGRAASRLRFEAVVRELAPLPRPGSPAGRVRLVDPGAVVAELAATHERLRAGRIGCSSRDDRWWRRRLADPEAARGGGTALRGAIYDTPGGPAGYALWRTVGDWGATGPAGRVEVHEVAADGPEAYTALWRLLLGIDLTRSVSYDFGSLDEPLLHLADEPLRLGAGLRDSLWIRLVDLPRALAARRYRAPVDVVVEVTDELLPANSGRWRLTAGPDAATCVPATGPADLTCGILELGAAYLGGTDLTALAAAGRVTERTPGRLAEASTAFGWHRLPSPMEVF